MKEEVKRAPRHQYQSRFIFSKSCREPKLTNIASAKKSTSVYHNTQHTVHNQAVGMHVNESGGIASQQSQI